MKIKRKLNVIGGLIGESANLVVGIVSLWGLFLLSTIVLSVWLNTALWIVELLIIAAVVLLAISKGIYGLHQANKSTKYTLVLTHYEPINDMDIECNNKKEMEKYAMERLRQGYTVRMEIIKN